jgi:steroid 5-alpha reductase family enzyme
MSEALTSVLLAWLAMILMMVVLWLVQRKTGNAGIVDVGWGMGQAVLPLLYFLVLEGYLVRQAVITAMGLLAGGRLAWHLWRRTVGHPEEGRYQALREEWGARTESKLFFFFQFQALLLVVFSLPYLLINLHPTPHLQLLELAGIGVWLVAFGGEALADAQLRRFKADPSSRGKVCRAGLWRYSRHPNYFFQWLMWVALAIVALAAPWGWLALVCPALMLYFLLKVTGIPPTEEQALRSKGEAYREYQRTTSAFFPWFPRERTGDGSR